MGKGGGCVPSKKPFPSFIAKERPLSSKDEIFSIEDTKIRSNHNTDVAAAESSSSSFKDTDSQRNGKKMKIFIVFYSMYGHVEELARGMKKGIDGIDGIEGVLFRVPETLSPKVLKQMKVPPRNDDEDEIPVITCASELVIADGILFGFPTRYGCMAAQMKSFFDSTGQLWKEQKLAGKPAGFFVSTGTQGGGQETTAWTAITQLAHHGMLFVPIGYTFGAGMFEMDSVRGGSPYGAGVYAGDGTRQPSETELALAQHQGKYMAAVVKRLAQA